MSVATSSNRTSKISTVEGCALGGYVAELAPGDALFIPTLWWHHVESLDQQLNCLVNYWWNGAIGTVGRTESAWTACCTAC